MPEIRFPVPLDAGGTKLHPGLGIVLSVGLAAIGVGIALWFVTDINEQRALAVILIAVVVTVGIAGVGYYLGRVRAAEHREYMENLHRIDRAKN